MLLNSLFINLWLFCKMNIGNHLLYEVCLSTYTVSLRCIDFDENWYLYKKLSDKFNFGPDWITWFTTFHEQLNTPSDMFQQILSRLIMLITQIVATNWLIMLKLCFINDCKMEKYRLLKNIYRKPLCTLPLLLKYKLMQIKDVNNLYTNE